MPVIRIEKQKNYTIMSNYHLQDRNISLKAKGLLSYMLSLPDYWEYSITGLASICKEGPDCIRSTVQELEEAGYITRNRQRLENGQLGGIEYVVRERPVESQDADKPISENPTQAEVTVENPRQINNVSKKERTKKSPYNPPRDKNAIFEEHSFNQFWDAYPKKVSKQAAIKAWNRLKPSAELVMVILSALSKQKKLDQWQNQQYIPNPASWLNGKRWEDEIPVESEKKKEDDRKVLIDWNNPALFLN